MLHEYVVGVWELGGALWVLWALICNMIGSLWELWTLRAYLQHISHWGNRNQHCFVVCIVCFWIETRSSVGIKHCVSSSSIGVPLLLEVNLIGKTNLWLPKANQSQKQRECVGFHFKQPLVNLGNQSTICEEAYFALLRINVQKAQSSFTLETDVVDQLLVFSYKCILAWVDQEFLLLNMLVVHPCHLH